MVLPALLAFGVLNAKKLIAISVFSLASKLLLKLVFFVYAQCLDLYADLSWGEFPTASLCGTGWVTLGRNGYGIMT